MHAELMSCTAAEVPWKRTGVGLPPEPAMGDTWHSVLSAVHVWRVQEGHVAGHGEVPWHGRQVEQALPSSAVRTFSCVHCSFGALCSLVRARQVCGRRAAVLCVFRLHLGLHLRRLGVRLVAACVSACQHGMPAGSAAWNMASASGEMPGVS